MATNNIISDIKLAFKDLIESHIQPIANITTGHPGVAPYPKGVSVTLKKIGKSPRPVLPLVSIILVGEVPNMNRGQTLGTPIIYRSPNASVPGAYATLTDEKGVVRTGPTFKHWHIQPQKWIFRFQITTLCESIEVLDDIHCQLQTLFEGRRFSLLEVTRNRGDEAEHLEHFQFQSVNSRLLPFEEDLCKSIIEIDVFAYHDTAHKSVKEATIQKVKVNGQIIVNL